MTNRADDSNANPLLDGSTRIRIAYQRLLLVRCCSSSRLEDILAKIQMVTSQAKRRARGGLAVCTGCAMDRKCPVGGSVFERHPVLRNCLLSPDPQKHRPLSFLPLQVGAPSILLRPGLGGDGCENPPAATLHHLHRLQSSRHSFTHTLEFFHIPFTLSSPR